MSSVQMTADQLNDLIAAIRSAADSVPPTASSPATQSKGNFSNCPSQFGGQRDHDAVEEFITSIVTYKEVEHISDEDALKSISLLFYGIASTWWQGIKKEAKTWKDAIELIRTHFCPTKPSYQLYMEIAAGRQEENVPIDTFICQKRALLAQLPEGRHDEETGIDLIYGLLHINYRKHIPRHDVQTFRSLLEKGRIIEHNNREAYAAQEQPESGPGRCTYCNNKWHTSRFCRKRLANK